jgi:hypothetical protein
MAPSTGNTKRGPYTWSVRNGRSRGLYPLVTCYALATHRPIYSYFPAFRAPSFFTIIPIYTHIIPTAPSGLDTSSRGYIFERCTIYKRRSKVEGYIVKFFSQISIIGITHKRRSQRRCRGLDVEGSDLVLAQEHESPWFPACTAWKCWIVAGC